MRTYSGPNCKYRPHGKLVWFEGEGGNEYFCLTYSRQQRKQEYQVNAKLENNATPASMDKLVLRKVLLYLPTFKRPKNQTRTDRLSWHLAAFAAFYEKTKIKNQKRRSRKREFGSEVHEVC